jgi:hypothetical protein
MDGTAGPIRVGPLPYTDVAALQVIVGALLPTAPISDVLEAGRCLDALLAGGAR